jgi:hypothetical protein
MGEKEPTANQLQQAQHPSSTGVNQMRVFLISTAIVVVCALAASSVGQPQDQGAGKTEPPTSNQLLMRDKLAQMNLVLEGLTLDKFEQVEKSADMLRMISIAVSWHIVDPTPRYERLRKNFEEQAVDLVRHAKERNTDAATLDLVRLNLTCAQCHQHMRENAAR